MRLPRRRKSSQPERTPAEELFHRMQMAASAEGKLLGEWLYEALAVPFDFTGRWGAPNSGEKRRKYDAAAKDFARRLADALAEKDRQG